jgi:hypothetical protein
MSQLSDITVTSDETMKIYNDGVKCLKNWVLHAGAGVSKLGFDFDESMMARDEPALSDKKPPPYYSLWVSGWNSHQLQKTWALKIRTTTCSQYYLRSPGSRWKNTKNMITSKCLTKRPELIDCV